MTSDQERIEEIVLDRISKGQAIDVYNLAKELLPEFPGQQLEQITELVSVAVVKGRGNAVWQKEELESANSESVRRTA
jgi:hypothetical protein